MKKIAATLLLLTLAACTTKPYTGEQVTQTTTAEGVTVTQAETRSILPGGVLAGTEAQLHEVSVKVQSVNVAKREVTVYAPTSGKPTTLQVSPEVRNLPQVKPGDQIALKYFTGLSFEVRPPTAEEIELSKSTIAMAARAPRGAKPGMVLGAGGLGILTVSNIDKKKGTVTLDNYGESLTIQAKHPENLNLVKRGDNVIVTASEWVAAGIAPAQSIN